MYPANPAVANFGDRTHINLTTHFNNGAKVTGGYDVKPGVTLADMFARDEASLFALGHHDDWIKLTATFNGVTYEHYRRINPVEALVTHLGSFDVMTNQFHADCDPELVVRDREWTAMPAMATCFMCLQNNMVDTDFGDLETGVHNV
jgi:hypothetical protein